MVITELQPKDVLAECRRILHLPAASAPIVDDRLLAALLRRSAGINCPCSRTTLRASVTESLQHLSQDETSLLDRIEEIIDALIVVGDLLELSDVVTGDPGARGTWVYAAPPSFVARRSGSIFLIGVVTDQDTFLPEALASRVAYEGFTRLIVQQPGEDLSADLREEGLQELSENVWLKCPRAEPAQEILAALERRLASQPPSGTIGDLQILDSAQPVTYYRGRWTAPRRHSGNFVARRPQEFGAPIWCFVTLEDAVPARLLDFPLKKTRWRGCDAAWHAQMALDFRHGHPQIYRRRAADDGVRLDFLSPLPLWAQRRLMIFGRPVAAERSLMSYWLPSREAMIEERFLRERLWLSCKDGANDGGAHANNP
jgi:hypothetical protein